MAAAKPTQSPSAPSGDNIVHGTITQQSTGRPAPTAAVPWDSPVHTKAVLGTGGPNPAATISALQRKARQ